MRRTALALCAIGALSAPPAAAQLLVDPLELTVMPTGTGRAFTSFSLANTSDSPVQATITRQDWDRLENGDNRFLPAGSTGASCGAGLTVSPVVIRVEPHTKRVIRLGVNGVALPGKECWDIFFVEEVPQRSAVRGNSLQYIFRTGVKVYVAPPGLNRDGAIEDLAVAEVSSLGSPATAGEAISAVTVVLPTKRQISIRFHNTGGMHLLAKGHLEFRRLDNSVAMQLPIEEFPTLPGATRIVAIDVPKGLAAGDYVVLALIDFGGAELVAGQIDFQAK